ncbi:MAG: ethanolamine ammonia-lyase subunit EutB [Bacteriovoracaceae bacterium]
MKKRAPVDLVFQSTVGTELANKFWCATFNILTEANHMALELKTWDNWKQRIVF